MILVAGKFRLPQPGRSRKRRAVNDLFKDPEPFALYIFPLSLSRFFIFHQAHMSFMSYAIPLGEPPLSLRFSIFPD
jgi:hypothetical protein